MVKGGLQYTNPGQDRQASISTVFLPLLIEHAEKGISFVADHNLKVSVTGDFCYTLLNGKYERKNYRVL